MKTKENTKMATVLLSCAALAALSATASAALMTYTATGVMSGSLGGTSFTDAAVTLRMTADTADVQYILYFNLYPIWTNVGVTTIDIVGFATAAFNGSNLFGAISVNYSASLPGTAATSIGDVTNLKGVLGNFQTAEPDYALATERTFTGEAASLSATYSTNLGDLITTGTTGNATFTAAEVSAVPEPGSNLALLALGAGGLTLRRRLKRAA